MSRFLLCLVFLLVSIVPPAFAGEAPKPPVVQQAAKPVDPKARELALELAKMINAYPEIEHILDTMSKNVHPLISRVNPRQSQFALKLVNESLQKSKQAHMEEINANLAELYAQNLSLEELQQIVGFYKSPVGQKVLTIVPVLVDKSMSVNTPVIRTVMREAMATVTDTLRKKGMKIPNELLN